jgi:glycosyltransferase involved in cell wall biosynthesis
MHLGIDISSLIYDRGVSRYNSNLVRALLKQNLDVSLYGASLRQFDRLKKKTKPLKKLGAKQVVIQKIPPKVLSLMWRFGFNPVGKQLSKIDVFHSWDWIQPPDKNLPLVSTIHDLAMLKFPETVHPEIEAKHRRSWKILKARKAQIITPSLATKKDVVELLEIPASRVHVTHEALPLETMSVADNLSDERYEQLKTKLKLDKPFLLFVGTTEPRKNLKKLIKAWQPLAKKYDLIIAGAAGWDDLTLKGAQPRFLGKVSNEELTVLYSEAEVFCYPSLYEGFGLPILEAFYFGTPVVTSNISSMPEVAGNAAQLVDPNKVSSIRQGIEKIINEKPDKQKQRLQKMMLRLQLFSWDKVAKETIEVYKKALQEKL